MLQIVVECICTGDRVATDTDIFRDHDAIGITRHIGIGKGGDRSTAQGDHITCQGTNRGGAGEHRSACRVVSLIDTL